MTLYTRVRAAGLDIENMEWGYFACPNGKDEDSDCPNKGRAFPRQATPKASSGGTQYRLDLPCTCDCYPRVGKQREKTKNYSRLRDKSGALIEVPQEHRAEQLVGSRAKGWTNFSVSLESINAKGK
jgi:hypothetical protein